jgi:hypothetical protein
MATTAPDGWDWEAERKMSPVLDAMMRSGIPLTCENYIGVNCGDIDPEDWTAEHEASLPAPFQTDTHWHHGSRKPLPRGMGPSLVADRCQRRASRQSHRRVSVTAVGLHRSDPS